MLLLPLVNGVVDGGEGEGEGEGGRLAPFLCTTYNNRKNTQQDTNKPVRTKGEKGSKRTKITKEDQKCDANDEHIP